MSGRAVVPALAAAAIVVWLAAGELAPAARLWTTFLLVAFPALMVLQARLVGRPSEVIRLPLYLASAIALWVLALLTLAIALRSGFTAVELGLVPGRPGEQLIWAGVVIIAAEAVMLAGYRLGMREAPLVTLLLPRTARERLAFVGLSLTAGITEELVFRGFLITVLTIASGSLTLALILSALTFGIVHAYQEPAGAARATVLGLLLSAPFVATGSLLGAMIAHAAIDVLGGFWLGPRLLRDGTAAR
ncbi:MAG TPA: CPBP family intramembrane glutamic endopeptidase [Longimicrobiales bacterium]|nr:CPBP family intramembrane glutamic endopeptidase [Longimicrobiales bacterium]